MQIKFLDLKPYGKLAGQLNVAYDRVFNSGHYIGGKEVEAFEAEWAAYCGAKYCVGVGNGHDALMLACKYFTRYYDYKLEAYIPWKTCLPTWAAASNGGFSGNPIQSGQDYHIAVHIYGHVNMMKYGGILIEDCAQAHGSEYLGIKAGKFGKVACWSFYPTKNLGALGDAGAVTTDDEDIYGYISSMHNYGTPDDCGVNSRLDPLQAAFLRVKLKYLDEMNSKRAANAQVYLENIMPKKLKLPLIKHSSDRPNWHIFAIETDDRYGLRKFLLNNGVETMVHYLQVPYPSGYDIPEAEDWARRTLSLPVAPHMTPYLCKQVSDLINEWQGV